MTTKKKPHQTKAEEHAEFVAAAAEAREAPDAKTTPQTPVSRFQRLQELARKRLQGTRAALLLDKVPARLEKAIDIALDHLGLVRKSKLIPAAAE